MAYASGSIQFDNALPDQYTRLTINDGQGTAYSEVTFHWGGQASTGYQYSPWKNATANQNAYSGQGALKVVPLYLSNASPSTPPHLFLRFDRNYQNATFWQDISTGGTTPARFVVRDYDGNEVKITFVNEDLTTWSDGTAVSGETRVRKQSAGEYHLSTWTNQYYPLLSSNFTTAILKALRAARDDGDINLASNTHLTITNNYLKIASDTPGNQGPGGGPISVMVERASGSWSTMSKDLFWVTMDSSGTFTELQGKIMAHVDEPDKPVYSTYNVTNATLSAGSSGAGAAMATYFAEIINNMGIQVSASVSSDTVSLVNDNEGTEGNISMSAVKVSFNNEVSTSGLTISGLSGGTAASGGGGGGGNSGGSSEMAQKRMTISAKQMELKASGGLSGSADNKAALVLDLDGLASTASLAQDDVLAMHSSGEAAPKKVSFSDLEDAVFANISGDATVAAGGDLTISSLAVENGMLAGDIENSKLINDSVTVVAGDALTGGGEVDLGASITLNVAVDDSSLEVSSDALQVKALGITNAMLAGSIASSKIAELNNFDTDDLSEGSSNQYFTQARARGSISVTDAGGDGSMSYDSSTGVITFTGPSASEVRAHFSGGTGVSITDGEVAIGQAVATSDNVQFADLVLTGDLTVGGTTTTVNSTEVAIVDKAIVLGSGSTDSQVAAASGAGLKIGDEDSPLATFLYDGVDSWDLSDHLNLASGQHLAIADANMLDADGAAKVRSAVAGDGLGHSAGLLSVNVDDSSIEIDSDSLQVKALGITNAMLAGSIESSKLAELSGSFDTDDLPEGSSNEYFTQARARGSISVTDAGGDGSLSYDSSTGVITFTGPSASEVRAHFSAVDAGGDGSFSYDSSTGAFTYTGPSASEVRAHFSGGEMIDFASGEFSINASEFSGSWDAALATKDTDDLAEGDNLYFTQARARASVSVTDAGGDGSLSYNSSTGVITYTGPSAAEVRAHFSGGDGIDLSSGAISVNVDDSGIEIVSDELKLKDSGVVTAKIADDAVTAAKIADDIAGDGMQIADGVLSISQAQEVFASSDLSANAATLSGTPASDEAVFVFMNGLLLAEGSSRDYTISGQVITLASENAMQSEDELVVKYINQ